MCQLSGLVAALAGGIVVGEVGKVQVPAEVGARALPVHAVLHRSAHHVRALSYVIRIVDPILFLLVGSGSVSTLSGCAVIIWLGLHT